MGLVAHVHQAYLRHAASVRLRRLMHAAIFAAILAPPVLLVAHAYDRVHEDTTEMALARRRTVAQLGAVAVRERLDHLTTLGRSLAGRVRFRALVREGRWQEAGAILAEVPRDFRDVERVFLADLDGVERADVPSLPGAVGKSFAYRDWYRGVTASWRPYVSEAYLRAAEPRFNVIAVAVPIESAERERIGILVMQVKLDAFQRWSRDIEFADEGFVYFVDRGGRAVGHPEARAEGALVDMSHLPGVRRVLRGERGVVVDPDAPSARASMVAAFEPVPDYGWGVVAVQAAAAAFAARQRALRSVLLVGGLALLVAALAAYVVVSGLETVRLAAARQEELARAQAEIDQLKLFNFVASHDLQEPLHKLTLFAGRLEAESGAALDAMGREHLRLLVDAADRMRRLVEQMRELARVATRAQPPAPVRLDEVVRAVLEGLAPEVAAAGARVEVEPLPEVLADRAQMEVLFRNLLGNAIKFRRDDMTPHIRIAGRRIDGTCEVAVADNGIGFEAKYAARIFEPFQRLHGRNRYPGSGLGLAICSRIVQRHGGTLKTRSAPGEGATFTVALPAVAPEREPAHG